MGPRSVPIVLADVRADAGADLGHSFTQIGINRAAAMASAVRHLLALGHRNLMYVGPTAGSSSEKWSGVLDAVRQSSTRGARAGSREGVRVRFASLDGARFREAAQVARSRTGTSNSDNGSISDVLDSAGAVADRVALLDPVQRPTALIAASDLIAMALIGRLADRGLRTPADVSVTGFDGDEIACRLFRPRLTTVLQPRELLAERVVNALLHLMNGGPNNGRGGHVVDEQIDTMLVTGESTAAPAR